MPTKATLLRQFTESMPTWRSKSTLYRYPRLCGVFIDFIGIKSTYTKADCVRFLNHILDSGLSKNYVRWSAYILKQFYESLGIQFPLSTRDLPQIGPEDIVAPIFTTDYVYGLIRVIKSKGSPQMKGYLALSTTYGFRRQELADISSSKSFGNGIIHIPTVKGGAIREHTIPEEIAPYLAAYKFKQVHPQTMANLFLRMQELAKLKHEDREGFHCLRRSLVTELLNAGVLVHVVYSFMGWKLSSRLGIIGVYARPDPKEVEETIYSKHPFLRAWS